MSKRQERALEVFLYVTFAIALVVGVGNTKSDTNFLSTNFEETIADSIDYGQAITNHDSYGEIQLQSIINFASKNDKVNALGRKELLKHATVLKNNPHLILNIVGHADSHGSERFNQVLSDKRATQVYEFLVIYGVPKEQLIIEAYDESGPDRGNSETNQCVELQYLSTLTTSYRR